MKVNAKRSCKENVLVNVDIFYFFYRENIANNCGQNPVNITKPS